MSKLFKHLKTVHTHRKWVRKYCFKFGLYWQGITHDLSKYSLSELTICKYYNGKQSPHQECREKIGYSPSWIHHFHKNKHHWEYWMEDDSDGRFYGIKMPFKYVVESVCDMIGASKSYNPKGWNPDMLWDYWTKKCKNKRIQHHSSEYLTEYLIWNFCEFTRNDNEERFLRWFKEIKDWIKDAYEADNLEYEMNLRKDNISDGVI